MSDAATLASLLYDFAVYVEAKVTSGLTEGLVERCQEVKDVALRVVVEDFSE